MNMDADRELRYAEGIRKRKKRWPRQVVVEIEIYSVAIGAQK
jgi:hypothetical protein